MWTWQRIAEAALVCACSVVVHVVNYKLLGGVAKFRLALRARYLSLTPPFRNPASATGIYIRTKGI